MDSGIGQEPFGLALQLSGQDIVDAICNEIAESLSRSCDLRATDSYRSFGGQIKISLQLVDLDTTAIQQEISIGTLDPELPTEQIVIDVPAAKRGYVSRTRGVGK
jgi:hypothetical protein